MHEFALADAVVKTALRAADEAGMSEISRIVVGVGELQQIERDLFEFSLSSVMPEAETRLAGTVFEINVEPARFGCRACGTQFADDPAARDSNAGEAVHFIPELAHAYLRCPECDGPDFEIIEGRGVTIRSIEGSVPEGEA